MLGCLATTSRQLRYWQSSETLFQHTIEVTPPNVMPHVNLGEALIYKGRIDEGIRQLDEALALDLRLTQSINLPPNNPLWPIFIAESPMSWPAREEFQSPSATMTPPSVASLIFLPPLTILRGSWQPIRIQQFATAPRPCNWPNTPAN